MAKRKMSLNALSEKVGITKANLSILKTGKAKAIRFRRSRPFVLCWIASLEIFLNTGRTTMTDTGYLYEYFLTHSEKAAMRRIRHRRMKTVRKSRIKLNKQI